MREAGILRGRWRKSSRCDTNSCVEVASIDGVVWVRNSEDPAQAIAFTRLEWSLFATALRAGEFDDLAAPPHPDSPGSLGSPDGAV